MATKSMDTSEEINGVEPSLPFISPRHLRWDAETKGWRHGSVAVVVQQLVVEDATGIAQRWATLGRAGAVSSVLGTTTMLSERRGDSDKGPSTEGEDMSVAPVSRICLVVEQAPLGSLHDVLRRSPQLSLRTIHSILQQVAVGMQAIAALGFVHGNLSTHTVGVVALTGVDDAQPRVTISGLPCMLATATGSRCRCRAALVAVSGGAEGDGRQQAGAEQAFLPVQASPRTTAIECLENLDSCSRVSERADVWSFGVLAWELLASGAQPYAELRTDEAVHAYVRQGGRLARPGHECTDILWSLIASCWETDVDARPRFAQLAIHLPTAAITEQVCIRASVGAWSLCLGP